MLLLGVPLEGLASECDGPTELVKVTVEQIAISPPTYIYTLANFHQSPIRNFSIGISNKPEMIIFGDNIPQSVGSPKGWEGQYIFGHESAYMKIYWEAKHELYTIAQNDSLRGFMVLMPQPSDGPSGKLQVPLDMKSAPYKVRFNDGTCVWGRAVEE
jgi:hypothetical protein